MALRDMVARHSDFEETGDFIPTPPWATRVLYEYVAPGLKNQAGLISAWDPACGQGHMLKVFSEYHHKEVWGSDVTRDIDQEKNWKFDQPTLVWQQDFVNDPTPAVLDKAGVIITNPPYKYANSFIKRGLQESTVGLALLMRIQVLEGERRYKEFFSKTPPTQIAFFSNRIPFKTGVVVKKAPKMFFHVWLWWEHDGQGFIRPPRPPIWIPFDAQTKLEKDADYEP